MGIAVSRYHITLQWIPVGNMIVPESSATLGHADEITHGLNGDHFRIAKFSSKNDPNFVTISTELRKLVSKIVAKADVLSLPSVAP
jgi:hypothetical protein